MNDTLNDTLVDSSYLYALFSNKDQSHEKALAYADNEDHEPIVPDIVLPEVAFLFRREGGTPAVAAFMRSVAMAPITTIAVTKTDLLRAEAIIKAYKHANLDFVDCMIVAFAERLNIRKIATFDRRDFSIIRPLHCEFFDLVPHE